MLFLFYLVFFLSKLNVVPFSLFYRYYIGILFISVFFVVFKKSKAKSVIMPSFFLTILLRFYTAYNVSIIMGTFYIICFRYKVFNFNPSFSGMPVFRYIFRFVLITKYKLCVGRKKSYCLVYCL